MDLNNIYDISKEIGLIQLWTSYNNIELNVPFFQKVSFPLRRLQSRLEQVSIPEITLDEVKDLHLKAVEISLEIVLHNFLIKIEENQDRINNSEQELNTLSNKLKEKLIRIIPLWEDRIQNALREIKVVRLSTNTNLNPEKLSKGAKSFFKESVWNTMSQIEKDDIEDACRCISLQAWTPAGMITMRVIEAIFNRYYKQITEVDPNDTWYRLINELKNEPNTNKRLLGYFDYLRDIRNSLQHPNARLSQFEAEELFQHTIHILSVINS